MGVEVVSGGGVEAVAPAKEVSVAVAPGAAAVAKNTSFREESNRLGDLKDGERKALAELRAKVEEAIVEGKLFDLEDSATAATGSKVKVEKKKKEKKEGKKKKEKVAAEKKAEGDVKVEAAAAVTEEKKTEEEAKEEVEVVEENKAEEAKVAEPAEEKKEEAEEKKDEEEEAAAAEDAGEAEKAAQAAAVIIDKDVALWGVPLLPSKGDEATDVVLLKFLRARDFKAGAAFEMLRRTLRWRRDWNHLATTSSSDDAVPEGACRLDGADREGHPVCYNALGVFADEAVYRAALGDGEGRARFLRWRVSAMESHVAQLDFAPGGAASLLQVTDLKGSPGPARKDFRVAVRQVVDLFQDNYPELVARNILINVPFSYYAFSTLFYPFLTQRTKSKFVVARPSKVTETLLKYIPIEAIPVKYGGLKRDGDTEFSAEDAEIAEVVVKASSTETIEIEATEGDTTLTWDLTVLGWEVSYKEEFVPSDEGSYTIVVSKGRKMGAAEEAVRNSFRAGEPGKVVITVENATRGKKKVMFRHKAKSSSAKKC
ncbi:patellin-4-like [Lolium rigidum]|uniref:patellin-4-like n=1 Tax=Lolium rigidum TaxID=89674 RepID=UPI001F5E1C39|nr:patellin-4-like [Lolium rigidum]